MPYVMVPVPEEHVEAVMQFVLRAVAQAALEDWDREALVKLWEDSDEPTRSLLSFTARAAAADTQPEVPEIARQMQLNAREALAIVNELTAGAKDANRTALVTVRTTTERLPNGRTVEKRVLVIAPDVAEMIREIERAELLDAAPPGAPN